MSLLDDLMQNAEEISDGYNEYRDLVKNTLDVVNIPKGLTFIGDQAYSSASIKKVIMPNSIISIGSGKYYGGSFRDCRQLEDIVFSKNLINIFPHSFESCKFKKLIIPQSVKKIFYYAFANCSDLEEIELPSGLTTLGEDNGASSGYVFYRCTKLKKINIPNATIYTNYLFYGCTSLEDVTIANGFNNDGLNLSYSTLYTAETIVSWLNALADRTGDTAYTLTIGSTNIAKLTAEQIAIATNKNWNLA